MVRDTLLLRVEHLINTLHQAGSTDVMMVNGLTNTISASNSSVLYPHKNSQTDFGRKTYHILV